MMEKICTFTGNRPQKLPWGFNESDQRCIDAKAEIDRLVLQAIEDGYDYFVCGMALGGDMYFAEAVLKAKRTHSIILECAVPFAGQAENWSAVNRVRYQRIMNNADIRTVLSDHFTQWCMHARNRYMVDKSDRVIAMNYASSGGTFTTVEYAAKKGKEIIFIDNNKKF